VEALQSAQAIKPRLLHSATPRPGGTGQLHGASRVVRAIPRRGGGPQKFFFFQRAWPLHAHSRPVAAASTNRSRWAAGRLIARRLHGPLGALPAAAARLAPQSLSFGFARRPCSAGQGSAGRCRRGAAAPPCRHGLECAGCLWPSPSAAPCQTGRPSPKGIGHWERSSSSRSWRIAPPTLGVHSQPGRLLLRQGLPSQRRSAPAGWRQAILGSRSALLKGLGATAVGAGWREGDWPQLQGQRAQATRRAQQGRCYRSGRGVNPTHAQLRDWPLRRCAAVQLLGALSWGPGLGLAGQPACNGQLVELKQQGRHSGCLPASRDVAIWG